MSDIEKVSIVVPIYNVEKYLRRCILSILTQSYENLEVILVNDGSTDSCDVICSEFAKEDGRIKYIKKENGGLSDARNIGLKNATGNYICFVDSDDYIDKRYVELLVDCISKTHSDMVICDFEKVYDMNVKSQDDYECESYTVENEEILKYLLQIPRKNLVTNHVWTKIYLRQLFNNVEFPVGRNFEDIGTTYKLICKSNKISILPLKLYYYYSRNDSIMKEMSRKSMEDKLYLAKERNNFILKNYSNLKSECKIYMYKNCLHLAKEIIKKQGKTVKKDSFFIELRNELINTENKINLSFKEKIVNLCIQINNGLLFNILKKRLNKE